MDTGDWEGTYIDVGEDDECCKWIIVKSPPHKVGQGGG